MVKRRILLSWVGQNDLDGFDRHTRTKDVPLGEGGAIRTLVDLEPFDEIHLLGSYAREKVLNYRRWLPGKTRVHIAELPNPTDYVAIYDFVNQILSTLMAKESLAEIELCIHLSSGTPTMTAIWVLLGKSIYPASFFQTFRGTATETKIPFDLALHYVPELLKEPDRHWQHLASQSPGEVEGFEDILGSSHTLKVAVGRAKRAALRNVSVLLNGESGTGKEMFARAIHAASARRDKPFVALNCAAIPEDLLESELFGHAKGAFTGADKLRKGAFEEADGGILFLDEIGECPRAMQAKLLRVLQPLRGEKPSTCRFRRVGESKERTADVRILAATNRSLIEENGENRFREDLYYRLAVITIHLPALRDRKGDLIAIAEQFLREINDQFREDEPGYQDRRMSTAAKQFVAHYQWPGNVRQLRNALIQAAVMTEGRIIKKEDLLHALPEQASNDVALSLDKPLGNGFSLPDLLAQVQRHYLVRAMEESGGVKRKAARLLGIKNYQTLAAQLKRSGLTS